MATFTVTSNANWQDATFSTRAGNDVYNINGATLTIDTDTRYCTNATATTGNLGTTTISSTLSGKLLIDGTSVRLITYTVGTGLVPAIGTTITNSSGGITGYLLGVWSALNVAPTAAGGVMPVAGFIKIKNATGSFTSGVLGGIVAISSGADVPGWIEIVGVDGQSLVCPRLGSIQMTGAFFEVGNTNGSGNQQIQMPASLTNTYYPGVWIETAVASNTFEFYPNVGTSTTVFTTDLIRGKVVWISAQGLLTIAKTSFGGYTPVTGLKIRVPNILLITCTSGAPTANSYNATPSSRFKFDTSTSGAVTLSKCVSTWYPNFVSPFSLTLTNCGFLDSFITSGIASAIVWDNIGVGVGTNINISNSTSMTNCFFGGTVSNSVFARTQLSNGFPAVLGNTLFSFTFTNCKFMPLSERASTTAFSYTAVSGKDLIFTNCTFLGGENNLTSIANITITNSVYCDLITGATTSSNAIAAFGTARCSNILINGLTFGGQTNAHPYDGIISSRDTDQLTIRNIGTSASPLSMGSANACAVIFGSTIPNSQAGNTNVRLQRVYVTNLRLAKLATFLSNDSVITLESCWGQAADTVPVGSQNVVYKNILAGGTVPTSFTAIYGTHFFDTFTSTTAGDIGLFMNEPSTTTSTYVTTSLATGSGFTSTGALVQATTNDFVTWTWPHYILGYTGFTAIAPTVTGTNSTSNIKYEYQIDKNDTNGFNGSYKNFYYQRTGGATTNTLPTVTMTLTTGVAVGDRIYGTNITAGTRVLSIDSSTQVTMSANSTGTASGLTFIVSALNGETSISATLGFKLLIRATCTTGSTSNTITGCYCIGTTDASSQTTQYPLDLVTASITVLDYLGSAIQNARVAIIRTSDNVELLNVLTNVSGIASGSISYTTNIPIDIRVRKSSTGTARYVNNDAVGTITSTGFTTTITLIQDTIALP